MMRLLKISVGVLVVALLMGLATPARGAAAKERRNRELGVCPLEFPLASLQRDVKGRWAPGPRLVPVDVMLPRSGQQAHRPGNKTGMCPIDFIFSEPGTEMKARRVREPVLSPDEFFFPWLGAQAQEEPSLPPDNLAAVDEVKGKIQGVYLDKSELHFMDASGATLKFFVSRDCKVFINNKEGKLSDLKKGDAAVIAHEARELVPLVATEIRCARK